MNAEQFNKKYPVGTMVRYYPIKGDPQCVETQTRTPAWTLGHGEAVVSVIGIAGGVSLEHVEIVTRLDQIEKVVTNDANGTDKRFLAMAIQGLNVKSWAVADNKPCTQVHIIVTDKGGNEFILRLKTRDVVNELIRSLELHRDYVWPARAGMASNGEAG